MARDVAQADSPRYSPDDVRRYYDRHTPGFLALGTGGGVGAIHRAVWAPGVSSRDEAFHFVDDRVADVIQRALAERAGDGPCHVVDLGCGVGASLCYLAQKLPIRGTGLTLSPLQVRLAAERARARGLDDRVTCLQASFLDIPRTLPAADVAYAIEAFAHATDPQRFFEECARLIRPAGALVVCDDLAGVDGGRASARATRRFTRGWHLNTLVSPDALTRLAGQAGFSQESSVDLSAQLEPLSVRDRLLDRVLGWLPLDGTPLGPVLGGAALKRCLARGWTSYRLVVFRRASSIATGR